MRSVTVIYNQWSSVYDVKDDCTAGYLMFKACRDFDLSPKHVSFLSADAVTLDKKMLIKDLKRSSSPTPDGAESQNVKIYVDDKSMQTHLHEVDGGQLRSAVCLDIEIMPQGRRLYRWIRSGETVANVLGSLFLENFFAEALDIRHNGVSLLGKDPRRSTEAPESHGESKNVEDKDVPFQQYPLGDLQLIRDCGLSDGDEIAIVLSDTDTDDEEEICPDDLENEDIPTDPTQSLASDGSTVIRICLDNKKSIRKRIARDQTYASVLGDLLIDGHLDYRLAITRKKKVLFDTEKTNVNLSRQVRDRSPLRDNESIKAESMVGFLNIKHDDVLSIEFGKIEPPPVVEDTQKTSPKKERPKESKQEEPKGRKEERTTKKETKEVKEQKEVKVAKEEKAAKEAKEAKVVKETKETKDAKATKDSKETDSSQKEALVSVTLEYPDAMIKAERIHLRPKDSLSAIVKHIKRRNQSLDVHTIMYNGHDVRVGTVPIDKDKRQLIRDMNITHKSSLQVITKKPFEYQVLVKCEFPDEMDLQSFYVKAEGKFTGKTVREHLMQKYKLPNHEIFLWQKCVFQEERVFYYEVDDGDNSVIYMSIPGNTRAKGRGGDTSSRASSGSEGPTQVLKPSTFSQLIGRRSVIPLGNDTAITFPGQVRTPIVHAMLKVKFRRSASDGKHLVPMEQKATANPLIHFEDPSYLGWHTGLIIQDSVANRHPSFYYAKSEEKYINIQKGNSVSKRSLLEAHATPIPQESRCYYFFVLFINEGKTMPMYSVPEDAQVAIWLRDENQSLFKDGMFTNPGKNSTANFWVRNLTGYLGPEMYYHKWLLICKAAK